MALYNVEFVHKISAKRLAASKPIELNPATFEDRCVLSAALRRTAVVGVEYPGQSTVLMKDESVHAVTYFGRAGPNGQYRQISVFPRCGVWHSIIFIPVEAATATVEPSTPRPHLTLIRSEGT